MSHYIRTIHTDFTASSSASPSASASRSSWATSPYAGTSASAHASLLVNLGGIMNKYPPGLGHSEWRGAPSSFSSGSTGASPSPYTRRRTGVSVRAPHSSPLRRAPPYRAEPASTTYMKFDPFSDDHSISIEAHGPARLRYAPSLSQSDAVLYRTPRTSAVPYTIQIPAAVEVEPALPPVDRNARSRLVAGILLNRVHAVGRPMRRRSGGEGPREYVKSGLSRVVAVEA
ncbi:hypothetical protein FPV67DRAFT_297157 [Lyophyllum atratum]|nr:hypothetical protein FPV67DRAFT_297157 [Lyophyllum atratum]